LREVLREFPKKGGRILDKAAKGGFADVVSVLLDMGVLPSGNGGVYVDERSDSGGEGEGDSESESDDGEEEGEFVPLHNAASHGHLECVKVLVEKGDLDVDILDDDGSILLLYGAWKGQLSVVQWLLEHGADRPHVQKKTWRRYGNHASRSHVRKYGSFETNLGRSKVCGGGHETGG
jgi:hypothetical protein